MQPSYNPLDTVALMILDFILTTLICWALLGLAYCSTRYVWED